MSSDYILFATVILAVATYVSCASYGETCGPDTHCTVGVGLICHETYKNCTCASGRFEQNLKSKMDYKMGWNKDQGRCFGLEGSLCAGTQEHPNPNAEGLVRCQPELTCLQIPDLPKGQGMCTLVLPKNSYMSDCDENKHCDAGAGLICAESGGRKKCVCGSGPYDHELSFNLEWSQGSQKCLALTGSVCIGTEEKGLPAGAEKEVRCLRDPCLQISRTPPGVGLCRSEEDSTSPAPPPTGPGSTGPVESTTAGATSIQAFQTVAIISASLFISRLNA